MSEKTLHFSKFEPRVPRMYCMYIHRVGVRGCTVLEYILRVGARTVYF
jgi:hypothetical protein